MERSSALVMFKDDVAKKGPFGAMCDFLTNLPSSRDPNQWQRSLRSELERDFVDSAESLAAPLQGSLPADPRIIISTIHRLREGHILTTTGLKNARERDLTRLWNPKTLTNSLKFSLLYQGVLANCEALKELRFLLGNFSLPGQN